MSRKRYQITITGIAEFYADDDEDATKKGHSLGMSLRGEFFDKLEAEPNVSLAIDNPDTGDIVSVVTNVRAPAISVLDAES